MESARINPKNPRSSPLTVDNDILRHFTTFYVILRHFTSFYDILCHFTTFYVIFRQISDATSTISDATSTISDATSTIMEYRDFTTPLLTKFLRHFTTFYDIRREKKNKDNSMEVKNKQKRDDLSNWKLFKKDFFKSATKILKVV